MSENYLIKKNIVLIANGEFPNHSKLLEVLNNAEYIICCDGAANSLGKINKSADIIIGDLDSINNESVFLESSKIVHIQDQNNNDFRKALNWISENMNIEKLSIFGSTGLREDHTIGNISTFLYKKYNFEIEILTNTGIFYVINNVKNIETFIGQYVSLFSLDLNQKITTTGLEYELKNQSVNLYSGTLNVAKNSTISIKTKYDNPLLVYLTHKNEKT